MTAKTADRRHIVTWIDIVELVKTLHFYSVIILQSDTPCPKMISLVHSGTSKYATL